MTFDLRAWCALLRAPGVGNKTYHALLEAFGSPEAFFHAPAAEVRKRLPNLAADKISQWQAMADSTAVDADLEWLAQGDRRHIIPLHDPAYPPLLRQIADVPPLLYVHGDARLLTSTQIAIVGSRNATEPARRTCQQFAHAFAQAGITVTSGLALGIDGAAHEGALQGGGNTIAVVGTGLDRVYPARHRDLAHRIAAHGAIVSEYPIGTGVRAGNFPRRNRIISGLSLGVLVVEASAQSGSLITARLAAEQGREVFAIPGSIHNPLSHGCHHLIRDGATLIETVDDILQALGMVSPGQDTSDQDPTIRGGRIRARQHTARRASGRREWQSIIADQESGAVEQAPSRPEPPDDDSRDLLTILAASPMSAEALASRLGWPIDRILITIQLLELGGYIGRHVDGRWQRLDGHQEALSGNPRLA